MYQSELTKKLLTPKQDKQLPYYGYGLTNIIKEPTRNQSHLKEKYLLEDDQMLSSSKLFWIILL